jgi:3-oxoacyl-[acyl-carrier protein] reductase
MTQADATMYNLEGQIALVTGSSRGIGATIATLFAQQGASVVVHGRHAETVGAMSQRINRAGGRSIPAVADLTIGDQVEGLRAAIEDQLGPVDIVVANAGGSTVAPMPLDDIDAAAWREVVDTNLTATFLTIKAFLPSMRARRAGTIITMSSAAARRPTAQSPIAYAAAKAGIELLTKELALQVGPDGIRVNCLAPETILTEGNRQRIPPAVQEQLRQVHPIRRLGTSDDVARAALFLASASSSWISGVTLDIAGGSVLV